MGLVCVDCAPEGDRVVATVTYRMVALSAAGEAQLDTFSREFDAMLATWEQAIARLTAGGPSSNE
jgi:hypothetical protein